MRIVSRLNCLRCSLLSFACAVLMLSGPANAQLFGLDGDPMEEIVVTAQRPSSVRDAELNRMIADQYAEAYNRELQGILQRAYDDAAAELEGIQQDIEDAEERVARACQAIRDIATESCVAQVQAYSYLCGSVVTLGTALAVEAPPVAVAIGGTGGTACMVYRDQALDQCQANPAGYQPTLETEVADLQERIASIGNASVTAIEAVYVPADDFTDPAVGAIASHVDSMVVLSRQLAAEGIYPAIDPIATTSVLLDPLIVVQEHANIAGQVREVIEHYRELRDVISLLGFEELGLHRIVGRCDGRNLASMRVMEKLGMRREGLFVEFVSFTKDEAGNPIYENTMQYALLRREWMSGAAAV